MKRFLFCISLFLLSTSVAFAQKVGKKSQTQDCGLKDATLPLKIAGFFDYPPFSWTTYDEEHFKNNNKKRYQYQGFIAEPLQKSLKEIQVELIDQQAFPIFEDALEAGKRGKIDLLFTSYYIDDTKAGLDYVYPAYFGNPFVVVSRADNPLKIDEPQELRGLKGVIRTEENIEPIIKGVLPTDTKIILVEGSEKAFQMLLSGEVDFMISSPYATMAEARRFKIWKEIHIHKTPIKSIKIFAAFSKMSECRQLKKKFEEVFTPKFQDKVAAEKRMQAVIDQWAELHKNTPQLEYTKP